jgi:cell division protein FtsI/penicillin-binding protein 2
VKNPNAWRFLAVQAFLILLGLSIPAKVLYLQYSEEREAVLKAVDRYQGWEQTIEPKRGEIYDRGGHLLAGNHTVYEVGVDIGMLNKLEAGARAAQKNNLAMLAQIYLGITYEDAIYIIEHPANMDTSYVALSYVVAEDTALDLIAMKERAAGQPPGQNLDQLGFTPRYQRTYPEGSLASNVLGWVPPLDIRGYSGVEGKFDSSLAGASLKVWMEADPSLTQELPVPPMGATLVLTFRREVQAAVEALLDAAVRDTRAEAGTVVVMDPQTGEILAMATSPRPDPSDLDHYGDDLSNEHPLNPAISNDYEPGSVFKIFTMAAALDRGVVTPLTAFFDTGIILVDNVAIRNWDNTVWGQQDMTGCLQYSINTCLVQVASQLGKDDFYTAMQKFGFGLRTSIDLAGETPGQMRLPGDPRFPWTQLDLATNAFGQGLTVTPIQMVMAASAIANEGRMVFPHVVYATVTNGRQKNAATDVIATPIRAETARLLGEMLAASLEGEDSKALVPGYRLAGKTGTAQIFINGAYSPTLTNASFVGWGPLDDPKFLVYVWLEKPQTTTWGSTAAAPLFKQVVEKLVVLMGIPPDDIRLSLAGP